jgi:GMP synthase-like glutamine amidotransferase
MSLEQADVALFTGGSDVTPSMYGSLKSRRTWNDEGRDTLEAKIFATCEDLGIMKLGICRGAQFLTVMSGGSLIQDVTDHGVSHEVFTKDKKTFILSSTHHQMMNPWGGTCPKFDLLAWSEGRSNHYLNGADDNDEVFAKREIEPEIVWYPATQALCIQAHPEIMNPNSTGVEYCRQLVSRYLT